MARSRSLSSDALLDMQGVVLVPENRGITFTLRKAEKYLPIPQESLGHCRFNQGKAFASHLQIATPTPYGKWSLASANSSAYIFFTKIRTAIRYGTPTPPASQYLRTITFNTVPLVLPHPQSPPSNKPPYQPQTLCHTPTHHPLNPALPPLMSLVLLAHACSHLQNASKARLGLTCLPSTTQLHTLLLQLQKSGYVNTVVIGGPTPPPPSALAPTMSANPAARTDVGQGHVAVWAPGGEEGGEAGAPVTQENVASRRLWVGLKYYNSRPVLEKMRLVSKPTRRVWMSVGDIGGLVRGERRGYVNGFRGIGESMFVTTDRGMMEARECVERRIGGMLLCRVNPVSW